MTFTQDCSRTGERAARSQRSVLLERDLRLRNRKYADTIAATKNRISNLEVEKARLTEGLINSNDRWTRTQFNDANMELENARNVVAACEERIAENNVAIQELSPSPDLLRKRREQQQRFGELASERLEGDRAVYGLISGLREALAERAVLTDRMRELAGALDLTVANGELDEFRFEPLSDALPSDRSAECERWHGWFTGQRPRVSTYIVRDEHLTVRETLADHGVYSLGDPIVLSEDEARELLREDRPPAAAGSATGEAPGATPLGTVLLTPSEMPLDIDAAPWRVQPPSIMTTAAYEEAAQTARDEGLTLREVLLRQDIDRELRAREAFLAAEEAMGARSRE